MTWLAAAGVAAPPAMAVALALAGVATATSPLWLKYLPWSGVQMSAFTYLVALAIAVVAEWLVGDLSFTRAGMLAVLSGSTAVWTIQQAVYAALKQLRPTLVASPPPALKLAQ